MLIINNVCVGFSKDHKFFIGDGVQATMDIDAEYFNVISVTNNGTHATGTPIKCGTTTVHATLHGLTDKNGRKIKIDPALTAKADLVIHTPVVVHPHIMAVPWDTNNKVR